MQPHIARTIDDIELKIGFLRRLAEALRNFDSVTAVGAPAPTETALKTPEKNGHARNGAKPPKVLMRGCRPSKRSQETARITGIVGKMMEPFNAALIASKASVDTKKAGNYITIHLKKGWLTRTGHGEYKRTEMFGGGRYYWRENVSGDPSRN